MIFNINEQSVQHIPSRALEHLVSTDLERVLARRLGEMSAMAADLLEVVGADHPHSRLAARVEAFESSEVFLDTIAMHGPEAILGDEVQLSDLLSAPVP